MIVYPNYYTEFQCIASRCRHSCCIGWEIDIDPETAEYYAEIEGKLGEKLRANIAGGEEAHFCLGAEERCPFLTGENLCELILKLGGESLCEICREHPRFRNFFAGREEVGLGLCCEEAARLLMTQTEKVKLLCEGESGGADAEEARNFALREQLFAAAQERTLPLHLRMVNVVTLAGGVLPEKTLGEWAGVYLDLERMESDWGELLELLARNWEKIDLTAYANYSAAFTSEYENLLWYFLYRHFLCDAYEAGFGQRAAFAALSVKMIFSLHALLFALHGEVDFAERLEIARLYSAEIEYSDKNPEILMKLLF